MPNISLGIDPSGAKSGGKVVQRHLKLVKDGAKAAEKSVHSLGMNGKKSMQEASMGAKSLGGELNRVKAAAAALGVVFATRIVIQVAAQYQDLRTSLHAVTGSAQGATDAFTLINNVVGKTPFTVSQLTQSFVKLKAAGLEPSRKQMMLFSDVASLTADRVGTLQAITDLYARTTAGGLGLEDLNRLADRGVPVFKIFQDKLGLARLEIAEVGKTAAGSAILLETLELGLKEVAGGASELAGQNLSVAFSNLLDAMRSTIDVMFNLTGATDGLGGVIAFVAGSISDFNEGLKSMIASVSTAWNESTTLAAAMTVVLIPAITALTASLIGLALSNPFTAIALIAVAGALSIVKNWDAVAAWFNFRLPAILNIAKAVWQGFLAILNAMVDNFGNSIKATMEDALNSFISPFNEFRAWLIGLGAKAIPIPFSSAIIEMGDLERVKLGIQGVSDARQAAARAAQAEESALVNAAHLTRQYNEELARLVALKADDIDLTTQSTEAAGALDAKILELQKRLAELGEGGTTAGSKIKGALETAKEAAQTLDEKISENIGDGFMDIIKGTQTVAGAFRKMASMIIEELFRIMVVEKLVASISGALGGFSIDVGGGGTGSMGLPKPFANGNAFQGGNVIPFASGGVVSSPTLFPMAGRNTGLMGEAGPEAIVPLARGRDGKLGIKSSGGGGGSQTVNQNVTINAVGEGDLDRVLARRMPMLKQMTLAAVRDERKRGAM